MKKIEFKKNEHIKSSAFSIFDKHKRKYSSCGWCGKTIDVTNNDNDICESCSKYPNKMEMLKEKKGK